MAQHVAYQPYPLYPADDAILLARIRAQVEFYFSQENLARDTFLSSILERNDNAVPVETIANFPKVRELYAIGRLGMMNIPRSQMPPADPSLLAQALEGSQVVTVSNNGQWIYLIPTTAEGTTTQYEYGNATPNQNHEGQSIPSSPSSPSTTASSAGVPTHPLQPLQLKERTTLLIQNVPEGTTLEDIMHVYFTHRPKTINNDLAANNNTWHVVFDNEADAMAALAATREYTIHGQPIQVSLKNEGVLLPPPQMIPAAAGAPSFVPQQQHYYPHPQEHPVVMQGYPVYDPYYGTVAPVMQPHQPQQQVYAGGGYSGVAPSNVYASHMQPSAAYNGQLPPSGQLFHPPPQQQQQYMSVNQMSLPNHHEGYVPPPNHHHGGGGYNAPQPFDSRPQQQYKNKRSGYQQNKRNSRGGRNYHHQQKNHRQNSENTHVDYHQNNVSQQNNNNDDKRKNTRPKKPHKKRGKSNERLAEFPALVENTKSSENAPKTAGYADALKKQPPKVVVSANANASEQSSTTSVPPPEQASGKSTSQLEQDMSKLSVSNTVSTEHEFWEVEEAPEVW